MRQIMLYLVILLSPFLFMIGLNTIVSSIDTPSSYIYKGIKTINSESRIPQKCTWICHQDTEFCKSNHVKYLQQYFQQSDPLYEGIIQGFMATGNYGLTNLIVLLFLAPLTIYLLLVKSIKIQIEIRRLKKTSINNG